MAYRPNKGSTFCTANELIFFVIAVYIFKGLQRQVKQKTYDTGPRPYMAHKPKIFTTI